MSAQLLTKEMMLITCIIFRGGGVEVLKALRKKGINSIALHHARGSTIGDPLESDGLPRTFEQEILLITVPTKEADEIFGFVYDEAKIDRPNGGFMYMEKLKRAVPFVLPNLPEG